MASTSFTLSPAIDLPLSVKAFTTSSRSVPLFPLRPLNYPPFRYKLKRKAAIAASVSRSNAVSEKVAESAATDTTEDSQTTLSPPTSSKLVLVVGGTGGVGQLVVASLLDRNVRARLLLRNPEKATTLFGEQDEEKLQVRKGDTRNPEDLDPSIFEGVTHVICCTGTTAFPSKRWDGDNTPEKTDWEGVRNLVSALPSSLKRIVLVSSVGVTKCNELPWSIMNIFGVLKYKKMGEDFVRNSGLPYTIIRPGRLTDGPYTSYDLNTLLQATSGERRAVVIGQGDKLVGEVSRLVVAEACIQALDIDFTQGQIYEINSVQLNAGIGRNLAIASAKDTAQRKSSTTNIERVQLPENVKTSKVLILGGTGRVGGSTAIALNKFCPDLRILIGGRNREKGTAAVTKLGSNSEFLEVDINDGESLDKALKGVDLVVHTAGPFQQSEKCTVLEAAIHNKIAYLDVCDDSTSAQHAKSYMNRALDANIPAITTGGIYPGVSNIMAAELVRAVESEGKGEPERLRFYYYTAGSGGAGPTILSTSFLLLGEEVVAYNKGEKIKLKPYSGALNIDFGRGIGKRDVYLLNLPEVRSTHEILGVPTVSARFGTAPFFWNWGMVAMTYLLPAETLRDRSKVQQLVDLFDPLVRKVDAIAGEKVSMRVDLDCSDGRSRVGIFTHRKLSESVGISTAAFALAILEGSTKPGVWFPEEPEGIAVEARETLLSRAAQGTINFTMNKAPWMVEANPKEIAFGIYI